MSQPFRVVGAGAAGLLAAAILRDECSHVYEALAELPHNHSAVLRFRSPVVGDALNIPFRKVDVVKASVPYAGNPIGDALAYSTKATGSAMLRSIASAKGEVEERWIAPPDFTERMASKVSGHVLLGWQWAPEKTRSPFPVISTVPMPIAARLLDYPEDLPPFSAVHGFTIRARLRDVQAHASLYLPSPHIRAYRASLQGDELIVEYALPGLSIPQAQEVALNVAPSIDYAIELSAVLEFFGLPADSIDPTTIVVRAQKYMKILPIDNDARERFILWASEVHNVYSLGRFATWRPGLLLDDIVNDVRVIQRIASGSSYSRRKAHASG